MPTFPRTWAELGLDGHASLCLGRPEDYTRFVAGHVYKWIGPVVGAMPNAADPMHAVYDGVPRLCTAVGVRHSSGSDSRNAVIFQNVEGSWHWGHLRQYFLDVTANETSTPAPVFRKGDKATHGQLSITFLDSHIKADTRLVLINGQSARINSQLLRRL